MDIITGLQTGKYKLGGLCKRSHNYNNTGQSVRLVRSSGKLADCVFCNQARSKSFYADNKEFCDRLSQERYWNDRENQLLKRKQWYENHKKQETKEQKEERLEKNREYHRQNKERERAYAREWYAGNPEKAKAKYDRYRQSHPEQEKARLRRNSLERKARKRKAFTIQIEQSIFDQKLIYFDNKCPYCFISLITGNNLSWDHVIPIAKGGTHTPNNLIPCCQKCNSSKCDSDIVTWFSSKPFFSEKKLTKIFIHIGKNKNNYNQLTLF